MAEYSRELTGLRGAAGLAGATGRSLLNIAQRSDLEKILGRSLEQEEFAEGAYRGEGQREQRMEQYGGPIGGGGLGALVGLILCHGDPRCAKWGYDAGAYLGEKVGQEGAVTMEGFKKRDVPEMPESLGEVPVRFHKSKAAILGKQRSDFNRYMQTHQVDLSTQRGRNTMNRFLDTMQFMVASNPQSSDMLKKWLNPEEGAERVGWWEGEGKVTDIFGFADMFGKSSKPKAVKPSAYLGSFPS